MFVLTGVAANTLAGPAVVVSFLLAATCALLAALSYSEFATSLPVAGGAFNYVSVTFGELAAWLCAWNMCLETTLSAAAVARGFTSYTATLFGLSASALQIKAGPLELDPLATGLIALMSLLLAKGTKESSMFNIGEWRGGCSCSSLAAHSPCPPPPPFLVVVAVVSGLNIASIVFVLVVGFPRADPANLSPFAPYGARGTFNAAAVVFFSFVGFDYVANAAEEAHNPSRDLPIGIVGSLGGRAAAPAAPAMPCPAEPLRFCPSLPRHRHAAVLPDGPGHRPHGALLPDRHPSPVQRRVPARRHGLGGAHRVGGRGDRCVRVRHPRTTAPQASTPQHTNTRLGIVTSCMTGLLGQARLLVVLGRERLLPAWLAEVSPRFGTPVKATLVSGGVAGVLALLLDIEVLADLVSIGTLFVFFAVCAAVVFR